jgi:hypothetical protein
MPDLSRISPVLGLVALTLLLQDAPCVAAAETMAAATARATAFDLRAAPDLFAAGAALDCPDADVAAHYLRGLIAARDAYARGGSPESLAPVRDAIAALDALDQGLPGQAEIARFVLMAASAAAQSERDEMALLLDHALRLESIQFAAKEPGAPALTAHEVAGDLWLQVHRYEQARAAYSLAAERAGRTRAVNLGLARSAARLEDVAAACQDYRALLDGWTATDAEPPEIQEARTFVQESCAPPN